MEVKGRILAGPARFVEGLIVENPVDGSDGHGAGWVPFGRVLPLPVMKHVPLAKASDFLA